MTVPDIWDRSRQGIDVRQRIALEEITSHTGSDSSLDLAVSWLHNCTIFHGTCALNQERSFRPSRLLHLTPDSICIHTTSKMALRVSYLTLSHCWGKHQLVRLLTSNLESFQQEIPYIYSRKPSAMQFALCDVSVSATSGSTASASYKTRFQTGPTRPS
jgi:hypothetical protein